jgi:hypothetical protein
MKYKKVDYLDFDFALGEEDYEGEDKMDWFGQFYQNGLSIKTNVKLFKEYMKEEEIK